MATHAPLDRRCPVLTSCLGLMLAACVAGCGSTRPAGLKCDLDQYIQTVRVDGISTKHVLSLPRTEGGKFKLYSAEPAASPELNVLSLSAGGEFGAFGAGFLKGWGSGGSNARPFSRYAINVVTGVSTGAVLATHAFLNTPEMDKKAFDLYTHISGDDIYTSRRLISYLWADSLFDTKRKDQLLDTNIRPLVGQVATEGERRSLYVGTVDFDSGEFLRVNMSELARTMKKNGAPNADACYVRLIGASSAIPVVFAPQFVDDKMLVDGGARTHAFLEPIDPALRAPEVKRRLVAIVHSDLCVDAATTGNGVLPIAGRTAAIATDQLLRDSIYQMHYVATSGGDKPRFETWYINAAPSAAECKKEKQEEIAKSCSGGSGFMHQDDLFCEPLMQCLAAKGEQVGKDFAAGVGNVSIVQDPDKLNLSSSTCPTAHR